jgi:hypothetical protein
MLIAIRSKERHPPREVKSVMTRPDRPRLEVQALEGRSLLSVTGLTAEASPAILLHPTPRDQPHGVVNQRLVPVTIEGMVSTSGPTPPAVSYQVVDEYGRDQPHGTIAAQPTGLGAYLYTTRIGLQLRRNRLDPDGRQYTIFVTASDPTNALTASAVVTVPHSRFLPGAVAQSWLVRRT